MLHLTRYPNQSIRVEKDLVITVLSVNKRTGCVRLGFQAPRSTTILREEVWERNQTQGEDEDED